MAIVSNAGILKKYLELDQKGSVQVEYVWIDGFNQLRSKTKTVQKVPQSAADLPEWNFDGSSTGQAEGHDSDVLIQPVALFADPFRGGDNKFVICETYNPDGTPHKTNYRYAALKVFETYADSHPWFGIEQEYMLFDPETEKPYGWPKHGFPEPQVKIRACASKHGKLKIRGCRANTIVVLVLARSLVVTLLKPTTVPACTPASRFPV